MLQHLINELVEVRKAIYATMDELFYAVDDTMSVAITVHRGLSHKEH